MGSPRGFALTGDHLFVADNFNGRVGEYSATTGVPINASFITSVVAPTGIAILDDKLFVNSFSQGKLLEYNATTGSSINPSFITGLHNPVNLAVSAPAPEPGSAAFIILSGLSMLAGRRRR